MKLPLNPSNLSVVTILKFLPCAKVKAHVVCCISDLKSCRSRCSNQCYYFGIFSGFFPTASHDCPHQDLATQTIIVPHFTEFYYFNLYSLCFSRKLQMSTNCVSFLNIIKFLMNNTSEICIFIATFYITVSKTYSGMGLFSLEVLYNH